MDLVLVFIQIDQGFKYWLDTWKDVYLLILFDRQGENSHPSIHSTNALNNWGPANPKPET